MSQLIHTVYDNLIYTAWLAKLSVDAMRYNWPFTVIFAIGFLVALIANSPFRRSQFNRRHLLVFVPLCIALLILAWGSIMRHADQHNAAPFWPTLVIAGLLIAQLAAGIWAVYMMKNYRWFSVSAVLLQQWIGLAFAFIARMSVTDNWM